MKSPLARNWDAHQIRDILTGETLKNGKPRHGHHAYSGSKYPVSEYMMLKIFTKYIPLIRNYNGHSIGEIKMNATNNDPIMTCNYIEEPEEMSRLYIILKKMEEKGANIEIKQEFKGHLFQSQRNKTVYKSINAYQYSFYKLHKTEYGIQSLQ